MSSDVSSTRLSIYPVNNIENGSKDANNKVSPQDSKSVGRSGMMFLSDVKSKYNNFITACKNFKTYATSTEGKIKFGVMGVGLAAGFVLSYKTKSRRLWYKRILPFGTLSLAASLCYPYKAWNVAKAASHGVVVTYNVSKIAVSYGYGKLKQLSEVDESQKRIESDIEGKEYFTDDKGILTLKTNKEESPQQPPADILIVSSPGPDKDSLNSVKREAAKILNFASGESNEKTILQTNNSLQNTTKTDLYSVLSVPKDLEKTYDRLKSAGDPGQSSADDKDLYTTR